MKRTATKRITQRGGKYQGKSANSAYARIVNIMHMLLNMQRYRAYRMEKRNHGLLVGLPVNSRNQQPNHDRFSHLPAETGAAITAIGKAEA